MSKICKASLLPPFICEISHNNVIIEAQGRGLYLLDILYQHLESESGGQFGVAENPTETFTCVCNGGEFVPRTGKVKVRSKFDVSEARAVSCALVSEASTLVLRPGFRIDFW